MKPADGVVTADDAWCLAGDGGYFIYSDKYSPLQITSFTG
jgi:hypothetical protein